MQNPRLAGRYAKSILSLASEMNQVDAIHADMKLLQAICKSNPDFVALLRSPVVKPSTKSKIMESVIGGKVNATTAAFIQLLIQKNREGNLPEITEAYIEQFNALRGIQRVKLTTAAPVSDEVKNAIINKVKANSNVNHIELETAVDEALIGGFVLELGDTLVDASISRDLNDIKKQFLNNQFVQNIR
ncbi:MAG: synthase subunit delta [Bacteroidota bacterium]|jgi:F-type H+-transporting ATPase subunit delta